MGMRHGSRTKDSGKAQDSGNLPSVGASGGTTTGYQSVIW
jgi:hypothetical protein